MHIKKEIYLKRITPKLNKKMIVKNICLAFLFGGIICLIGQAIITIFKHNGVDDELSSTYMIGIMILAAGVSSAFGFYDRLGQIGKCGFSIPITGFANSMISSAMEYKPEGIILGIGANVFKLASSVLAMGVFSAIMMAIIRYLVSCIWKLVNKAWNLTMFI